MKKILMLLVVLMLVPFTNVFAEKPEGLICPEVKNLIMATTQKDKSDLTNALTAIIPKVYGAGSEYKEWRIEVISPMPQLTGFDVNYRNMAANFCGTDVANYSWFVRLRFPRLLPAQSASLGELYIVKDKKLGWTAWFQYH